MFTSNLGCGLRVDSDGVAVAIAGGFQGAEGFPVNAEWWIEGLVRSYILCIVRSYTPETVKPI